MGKNVVTFAVKKKKKNESIKISKQIKEKGENFKTWAVKSGEMEKEKEEDHMELSSVRLGVEIFSLSFNFVCVSFKCSLIQLVKERERSLHCKLHYTGRKITLWKRNKHRAS